MFGGAGNDIYYVDSTLDVVTETDAVAATGGIDKVFSSVSRTLSANVENLTLLGSAAINGAGNALNNVIVGNTAANILSGLDGNDTLDGGAGDDKMFGGAGSDTYLVDSVFDTVTETDAAALTGGIDKVISSVSYAVSANVENLSLSGNAIINGIGNGLGNVITGNDAANILSGLGGDDTLNGALGDDKMFGGDGNDTYIVNSIGDTVSETNALAATGGVDRVISSVTWTLDANVERLNLAENGAIDGTGNTLANVLNGNSDVNTLNGLAGNDVLRGFAGNDVLIGGLGKDTLVGGAGADTFVFKQLAESGPGILARDVITDFVHLTDKIDLSAIDANNGTPAIDDAFTFIGGAAFGHHAGELRVVTYASDGINLDTRVVVADVDGNGVGDFQIQFTGLVTLTAQDFIL